MTGLAAPALPIERLTREALLAPRGKVAKVVGLVIEATAPPAAVGDLCRVGRTRGNGGSAWPGAAAGEPSGHAWRGAAAGEPSGHAWRGAAAGEPSGNVNGVLAEVVGFRDNRLLLMPLGEMDGVCPGAEVVLFGAPLRVPVGASLLGRVLDGMGQPMDGRGPLRPARLAVSRAAPPDPLARRRVSLPLPTGIRAIDGLLTVGLGQRIGIFAGSGVGKSTLLGMIARRTEADVNVIALVGERGREVREFIERDLGPAGLARSVLVVATSDAPPQIRRQAAYTATAIAEWFRDAGHRVLLMMDSITRFATAQREIGLATGEPPSTRGYTPSVFAQLSRLLERSGTSPGVGAITGLYTILVEGDDHNEPVADAARSILDGHVVLSRELASRGHYPAIDVLQSVSRCMPDIVEGAHGADAQSTRALLAAYQDVAPLLSLGAYRAGALPQADQAIARWPRIEGFLRQGDEASGDFADTVERLASLLRSEP